MSFVRLLTDAGLQYLKLPPRLQSNFSEEFVEDNVVICFDETLSWSVVRKRVGNGVCFIDGWSKVIHSLQLIPKLLLVFREVQAGLYVLHVFPYVDNSVPRLLFHQTNPTMMAMEGRKKDVFCNECFYEEIGTVFLPNDFVKYKLPKNALESTFFIERGDGSSIPVRIVELNDQFIFSKPWYVLLEKRKPEYADLLIFEYDGHYNFRQTWFPSNEHEIVIDEASSPSEEKKVENTIEDVKVVDEAMSDESSDDVDAVFAQTFYVKISRKRLRLPKKLSLAASCQLGKPVFISNLQGRVSEFEVVTEKSSGGGFIFVVKHWCTFMEKNGIKNGDTCCFQYDKAVDTIKLIKVSNGN